MNKKKETARALMAVVTVILNENDDAGMHTPRAAKLPSEWRAPLVHAANNFQKAWAKDE